MYAVAKKNLAGNPILYWHIFTTYIVTIPGYRYAKLNYKIKHMHQCQISKHQMYINLAAYWLVSTLHRARQWTTQRGDLVQLGAQDAHDPQRLHEEQWLLESLHFDTTISAPRRRCPRVQNSNGSSELLGSKIKALLHGCFQSRLKSNKASMVAWIALQDFSKSRDSTTYANENASQCFQLAKTCFKTLSKIFPNQLFSKMLQKVWAPLHNCIRKTFQNGSGSPGSFSGGSASWSELSWSKNVLKSFENNWPKHVSKCAKMSQVLSKMFSKAGAFSSARAKGPTHIGSAANRWSNNRPFVVTCGTTMTFGREGRLPSPGFKTCERTPQLKVSRKELYQDRNWQLQQRLKTIFIRIDLPVLRVQAARGPFLSTAPARHGVCCSCFPGRNASCCAAPASPH